LDGLKYKLTLLNRSRIKISGTLWQRRFAHSFKFVSKDKFFKFIGY